MYQLCVLGSPAATKTKFSYHTNRAVCSLYGQEVDWFARQTLFMVRVCMWIFAGDKENSMDKILKKLDEAPMQMQGPRGCTVTLAKDDYDVTAVKSQVMANVHEAVQTNETRVSVQAYYSCFGS